MPGLSKLQKEKIKASFDFYRSQVVALSNEALQQHINALNNETLISSISDSNLLQLSLYIISLRSIYISDQKEIDRYILSINGAQQNKNEEIIQVTDGITPLKRSLFDLIDSHLIVDDKLNNIYQKLIELFINTLPLSQPCYLSTKKLIFHLSRAAEDAQTRKFHYLFTDAYKNLTKLFYQLLAKDEEIGHLSVDEIFIALSPLLDKRVIKHAEKGIISFAQILSWQRQKLTFEIANCLSSQPADTLIESGYIANLGEINNIEQLQDAIHKLNVRDQNNSSKIYIEEKSFKTPRLSNFLLSEIAKYNLMQADAIMTELEKFPQSVLNYLETHIKWLLPEVLKLGEKDREALLSALWHPKVQKQLSDDHNSIHKILEIWSIQSASQQADPDKPSLFAKLNHLNQLPKTLYDEGAINNNTQKLSQLPIIKYDALQGLKKLLNERTLELKGLLGSEPSGIKKIRRHLSKLPDVPAPPNTDTAKIEHTHLTSVIFADVMKIMEQEKGSYFRWFRKKAVNDFYQNNHASLSGCCTFDHLKSAYAMGRLYLDNKDKSAALICFNEVAATDPNYALALYEASQILYERKDYAAAMAGYAKAGEILLSRKEYLLASKLFHDVGIKLYEKNLYALALEHFKKGEAAALSIEHIDNKKIILKFSQLIQKLPPEFQVSEAEAPKDAPAASSAAPKVDIYIPSNSFSKEMHEIVMHNANICAVQEENVKATQYGHLAQLRR